MLELTVHDTQVPALGLGTWQLEGQDCVAGVAHALEVGYRHIDTAKNYHNEAEVGAGLRASGVDRSEIFLATKIHLVDCPHDAVFAAADNALAKLDTEYIDLLMMHWPSADVPVGETLGAMRQLQEQGKIRHIGLSNFTTKLVAEAAEYAPIFSLQVEYHPYLAQTKLLDQARKMGHMLTAYSPAARGNVVMDPVLIEIGHAHGKSPVQATLRWLLQHDQPVAVIPKASSAEHRLANLDIFDFELSADEMAAIHHLARGERHVSTDFAPVWDK